MKKKLGFFIPILCFVIIWEIISQNSFVNPNLFPPPSKVATALWSMMNTGIIFLDIRDSFWRLIIGLFLGSSIGVFVGLLAGRLKLINFFLSPVIQVFRPLPPVAIIPLVIIWLGIDNSAKIFSIAFAVFFPVWLSTHLGAQQIPKIFLWSGKLFIHSPFKKFIKIIFPASLPFIITGIRTGIATAFIMIFVSELTGASGGVGYRISVAHLAYNIDEMMAALVVLAALGATFDQLFVYFTNKLFPWLKLSLK